MMPTALVPVAVPFHNDVIICVEPLNQPRMIALKRTCEAIGIDYEGQFKRLRRQTWATVSMMEMVADDGKIREMVFIDRRTFAMWLATIDANRLSNSSAASKVAVYQKEAADVLDRHFFGDRRPTAAVPAYPDHPYRDRIDSTWVPHNREMLQYPWGFTIFSALNIMLFAVEDELLRHNFETKASDRPDVSVGACWANDRRSRGMEPPTAFVPLLMPDTGVSVPLSVYRNEERGDFNAWFHTTYLPEKLPNYLANKPEFGKRHGVLPTASVADHVCLKMATRRANLKPPIRKILERAGGFFPVGFALPAPASSRAMLPGF